MRISGRGLDIADNLACLDDSELREIECLSDEEEHAVLSQIDRNNYCREADSVNSE